MPPAVTLSGLRIPAMLHVRRQTLARMLRSHGENALAERALSVTDDELKRIGELGGCYAFSEHAMATGGSMGGARALSMPRSMCSRALPTICAGPAASSS